MKQIVYSQCKRIFKKMGILPYFSLFNIKKTYLDPLGWSQSIQLQRPIGVNGVLLPWMNYGVTSLLNERIPSDIRVLEYGSGGSTLWWAERVSFVLSVEHDKNWLEICRQHQPQNVELRLASNDSTYPTVANTSDNFFDVIVIDAVFRTECAEHSLSLLSDSGVIIWDDAERPEFSPGFELLHAKGFRSLCFYGLKPASSKPAATRIFYRNQNILGI